MKFLYKGKSREMSYNTVEVNHRERGVFFCKLYRKITVMRQNKIKIRKLNTK
jgi:hypothetical protein